ncbi:MAG: tripartite tricarboxylate transporter TctB family protein [Pseudomonadota bacterium]|nr:tripartite tricarboxylate transporter TctB family protein [Pseudomonadota bacterium]
MAGETATGEDSAPVRGINFNTIAAVIFIAFSVVLFLIIPHQIDKPLINLGGAGTSNLKAETFPQIIAAAFALLGIWYLFVSFRLHQRNLLGDLNLEAITNVLVTLIMMTAYVGLIRFLGFVVGSAIMVFVMSTYFGNRNYLLGGTVSIAVPLLVFVLFTKPLATSLPPFPVDEVIPKYWVIHGPIKYLSNKSIL